MPYNMWFVTPSREVSPAGEWIDFVAEIGEDQRAELTEGTPNDWREICVNYTDGSWSFDFVRYPVDESGSGAEEVGYFREGLGVEPAVNAQWVSQYLTRVKTVYLFRCSINAPDSNLELVREIVESLQSDDPGGLLYAEGEGWSNEGGQHITWEFSDGVTGEWWMALRRDGGWSYFQMELGDRAHRAAFQAGEVPAGVEVREYRD